MNSLFFKYLFLVCEGQDQIRRLTQQSLYAPCIRVRDRDRREGLTVLSMDTRETACADRLVVCTKPDIPPNFIGTFGRGLRNARPQGYGIGIEMKKDPTGA